MHEEAALVFIQRGFGPFEHLLPFLGGVEQQRLLWAFQEHDGLPIGFDLLANGRRHDKTSLLVKFTEVLAGKHCSTPSLGSGRGSGSVANPLFQIRAHEPPFFAQLECGNLPAL